MNESHPADDTRPRTQRPTAIRWACLFLFSLALILFDPVAGLVSQSADDTDAKVPDPADATSPMLEMQARYAVGVEQLLNQPITEGPLAPTPERYMKMAGESQIDRARAVMLIARLFSKDDALEQLDRFRAEYRDSDRNLDETIAEDLRIFEGILTGQNATKDERQRLIDHHHLFGRLAVAQIEDDPHAQELRARIADGAKTLAIAVFAFGASVLALVGLGVVLLIILAVLFANGIFKPTFGRELRRTPSHEFNRVMTETAALFMGVFFLFKLVTTIAGDAIPQLAQLAGQFALAALILWPVIRIGSLKKSAALMGWSRGKGIVRELGAGLFAYIAGLPILALGMIVALLLITIFGVMPSHPVTESLPSGGVLEIVLLYALACVWAPIVEESVFRGAFYRAMRVEIPGVAGIALASLTTSFVFAAIHPQGIFFVPPLMALAIVFAFMREWRGSLIAPMFTHALHNAAVVTFSLILFGI